MHKKVQYINGGLIYRGVKLASNVTHTHSQTRGLKAMFLTAKPYRRKRH